MKEQRYQITVTAEDDSFISTHVREAASSLEDVSGIVAADVERLDNAERDISELKHILDNLSAEEVVALQDVIDYYTEDEE